ncbi:MAG TPA: DUF465 domain-containing protein [Blastocatellia bacterium]|nr:DUF465 domain-containing protein [Blastocatellia bacterium]
MDISENDAVRKYLLDTDSRFAKLVNEHTTYEHRLSQLSSITYPSNEEQIEESTLKKKKLLLKDQIESIVRTYNQQHQVAGR